MRLPFLALLAFGIQLLVIEGFAAPTILLILGLFLSHLLLLVVVAVNRRLWGIRILGIGLALNLLAIACNGGLMPATQETLSRASMSDLADGVEIGHHIPGTKNVLLERSSIKLYPLTDILVISFPSTKAYSVGDLLIAIGMMLALGEIAGRIIRKPGAHTVEPPSRRGVPTWLPIDRTLNNYRCRRQKKPLRS